MPVANPKKRKKSPFESFLHRPVVDTLGGALEDAYGWAWEESDLRSRGDIAGLKEYEKGQPRMNLAKIPLEAVKGAIRGITSLERVERKGAIDTADMLDAATIGMAGPGARGVASVGSGIFKKGGKTTIVKPKQVIHHGVLDTKDISSIYKGGLRAGTSVEGQAFEHPIILRLEKGEAGLKSVQHRPGDYTTVGKSGSIKEIWLDKDEFIKVRDYEPIAMDMINEGERLGLTPEQIGGMEARDFARKGPEYKKLTHLARELEHSDKFGPSKDYEGYLEELREATEGKVPIKVFSTNTDIDPPKRYFTGEGYQPK